MHAANKLLQVSPQLMHEFKLGEEAAGEAAGASSWLPAQVYTSCNSLCAGFLWRAHLVWRSAVNSSGSLQSTL